LQRRKLKQKDNGCGCTCKLRYIWKQNTSRQTRSGFIPLKPSLKSMRGIYGCPKNKRHLTSLNLSHGKNLSWD
jgi:hypothetical protein